MVSKMAQLQEKFTEFYKRKYHGRNLQWQPVLGHCLVKGYICSNVRKCGILLIKI